MIERPVDERIVAAAMRYWKVKGDFFLVKKRDGYQERRFILFWLLYNDAELTPAVIAKRYDRSRGCAWRGIGIIELWRKNKHSISKDIEAIREISGRVENAGSLKNVVRENNIEVVKKMRGEGMSYGNIAKLTNIPRQTVYRYCNKEENN